MITFEGSIGMKFHMLFGVPKEIESMESTKDFRPELTVYDPYGNVNESFMLESIETRDNVRVFWRHLLISLR